MPDYNLGGFGMYVFKLSTKDVSHSSYTFIDGNNSFFMTNWYNKMYLMTSNIYFAIQKHFYTNKKSGLFFLQVSGDHQLVYRLSGLYMII